MKRQKQTFGWIKVAIPLILLGMILTRLVWMQIKPIQPTLDLKLHSQLENLPDPSSPVCQMPSPFEPGLSTYAEPVYAFLYDSFCQFSGYQGKTLVRWNQGALFLTVLFTATSIRILTSSWIIGLAVATTILSRGSIMNTLDRISIDSLIHLLTSLWFLFFSHYLRSASSVTLVASSIVALVSSLIEPSLFGLCLTYFFVAILVLLIRNNWHRPIWIRDASNKKQKTRGTSRTSIYQGITWIFGDGNQTFNQDQKGHLLQKGSLLVALRKSFLEYLRHSSNFVSFVKASSALLVLGLICTVIVERAPGQNSLTFLTQIMSLSMSEFFNWIRFWVLFQLNNMDIQLILSVVMIYLFLLLPATKRFLNLWLGVAVYQLICFVIFGFSFFQDTVRWIEEFNQLSALGQSVEVLQPHLKNVVVWMKPFLIAFGIGSFVALAVNFFRPSEPNGAKA